MSLISTFKKGSNLPDQLNSASGLETGNDADFAVLSAFVALLHSIGAMQERCLTFSSALFSLWIFCVHQLLSRQCNPSALRRRPFPELT
jgi:hypothetical protein